MTTSGDAEEYLHASATGTTLSFWAARRPDVPAVTAPDGERSFAALDAEANRVARVLRRAGLVPGDAVAVLLPNRCELAVVYYAALRAGLRFVPVNRHLAADEVHYVVDDCEALAVVADHRFAEVADAATAPIGRLRLRLSVGGAIPGFRPLAEAAAAESPQALPDPVRGRWMFYTSGTTGRPKGVVRDLPPPSADGMGGNTNRPGEVTPEEMARAGIPDQRMEPGVSRHLCTGPLYHAGPLNVSLTVPLAAGVGVVLMDDWSPEETLRLIAEHRITHSHMVPTMFTRLLALDEHVRDAADVSSLRYVWHGAAQCPVSLKKAMIDWWGPVLLEYYAATEGSVTYVSSEDWLRRPGTVGRPTSPDKVLILDEDGEPLPPGHAGTIWIKAPAQRFSYLKSPEKTAGSYRGDHYTLGDIGYLDEDGFLFLTDRVADLIITGGVNVYPAEVEARLTTHPAVRDVAVLGVPDPEWGERVIAVVEPVAGTPTADDALAADLIHFCRTHIAHFKCPKEVHFVTALPRTDAGKLPKRELRERYRARAAAGTGGTSR
ncbi:putative acyl-CoA ligase [Pseudonocardia sulfidoxydans NBRC 16205]|uniref:Putative acyl-CoA ligase n=1 Tax=Pseudonocardia sulfidoxydans NBRC 16205 TaxID=1223511 RepID=A0A511DNZ7_9PSEU|nr:AMP-binding protein [Pseudonocardia sulfidoxydans]GEL26541.1 putative acyl-CoA ligase [Pseudonocardia sulfidoxydans NBRC 16205]